MAKTPQELVRPEILGMQAYHVSDAAGMVKLDAMENPYRLPPQMKAEMGALLAEIEMQPPNAPNPAPSISRVSTYCPDVAI